MVETSHVVLCLLPSWKFWTPGNFGLVQQHRVTSSQSHKQHRPSGVHVASCFLHTASQAASHPAAVARPCSSSSAATLQQQDRVGHYYLAQCSPPCRQHGLDSCPSPLAICLG